MQNTCKHVFNSQYHYWFWLVWTWEGADIILKGIYSIFLKLSLTSYKVDDVTLLWRLAEIHPLKRDVSEMQNNKTNNNKTK